LLKLLNKLLKTTLHRKDRSKDIDDGLNIGILYVSQGKIVFSGARHSLYIRDGLELRLEKGDNKSIGYRSTPDAYEFTNHHIKYDENTVFYMTTDGFIDQNGGEKNYSFGRTKFEEIINGCYLNRLTMQKDVFEEKLKDYMSGEEQRDDITVLGFKL
jgi:serine phosphatase RsbU (regulator of sigma subunit)